MSKNTIFIIVITVLLTLFASSCVEEEEVYTDEEVRALIDRMTYSDLEELSCPIMVDCRNKNLGNWDTAYTVSACENADYSRDCFECIYQEEIKESSCNAIINNCSCPSNQSVDDDDDDVSYSTLCYFIRDDPDDGGCGISNLSSISCNSYMNENSTFRNCIEDAYYKDENDDEKYDKDCGDAYDCIEAL